MNEIEAALIALDPDVFLLESVRIDERVLSDSMVEAPAQQAYWNARLARAYERFLRAKVDRNRVEARLQIEVRAEAEDRVAQAEAEGLQLALEATARGDKKAPKVTIPKAPTEAAVKALVQDRPEMRSAEEEAILAEVEHVRIRGVCEAVRTKCDMLRSLGARLRAELEHDPSVRERVGQNGFERSIREREQVEIDDALT